MLLQDLFESKSTLADVIKHRFHNNFRSLVQGEAIPLFRGMDAKDVLSLSKVYEEDGITFYDMPYRSNRRRSTSGSNFILNYISIAPEWQDIPDRGISTFCSNEIPSFGDTVYAIIPHDHASRFATIDDDFNYSQFPGKSGRLLEFRDFRSILLDVYDSGRFKYDRNKRPEVWEKYTDRYNIIENNLNSYLIKKVFVNRDQFMMSEFTGALDCLQKILDVEKTIPIAFQLDMNDEYLDCTASSFIREHLGNLDPLSESFDKYTPDFAGINVTKKFIAIKNIVHGPSEIWFEEGYLAIKIDHEELKKLNKTPYTFFHSEKFKSILKQLQDKKVFYSE